LEDRITKALPSTLVPSAFPGPQEVRELVPNRGCRFQNPNSRSQEKWRKKRLAKLLFETTLHVMKRILGSPTHAEQPTMKNARWYLPLRLAFTDSPKSPLELCLFVWRARQKIALVFEVMLAVVLLLASGARSFAEVAGPAPAPSKFKVLVLAEAGSQHLPFVEAAKPWLKRCSEEDGFSVDYIQNTDTITEKLLGNYKLFLQLDYPPYNWKPEAMAAFKSYIENGKGGWVGFHHATLLGKFDGYPMWTWFSGFMGGIKFDNYIAKFAAGNVRVEDKSHPCMKGVPEAFLIPREEWYTYDKSPRANVRVLASVDESSYSPDSNIKMGDHPVIWTNEHMAARNVYILMGHGPDLFQEKPFTTIFRNSILWAAGQ
jgi:type 1 glutamine amidotransferase